ncbi:hypothetical protein I314_03771 [Cryptococcus bacillisporus CA1873]|uniref:Uncharacterized protein n=1 Tax=Cryptococcus bacillisporus CA1873 TaxID=1296111 RepID=A0ABR5BA62_CRYGA|nr:hypothetical protein I314_03771 [Cryptococcus bacillisporus CA1873]|eukprot:KIR60476.1 hypothetical protein I314_03771 [Cryptococcus gattii CA1873]
MALRLRPSHGYTHWYQQHRLWHVYALWCIQSLLHPDCVLPVPRNRGSYSRAHRRILWSRKESNEGEFKD